MTPPELIAFGTLGRPHGLRGEIPLRPFNERGADLLDAELPLAVRAVQGERSRDLQLTEVRPTGQGLLARFQGVNDRDAAAALTNAELWLPRAALPDPEPGEFFVADLIGCQVVDLDGRPRGTVTGAFWNGAQDVLRVARPPEEGGEEWLIPAVAEFLHEVDLAARRLVVDPHE